MPIFNSYVSLPEGMSFRTLFGSTTNQPGAPVSRQIASWSPHLTPKDFRSLATPNGMDRPDTWHRGTQESSVGKHQDFFLFIYDCWLVVQ